MVSKRLTWTRFLSNTHVTGCIVTSLSDFDVVYDLDPTPPNMTCTAFTPSVGGPNGSWLTLNTLFTVPQVAVWASHPLNTAYFYKSPQNRNKADNVLQQ